MAESGTRVILSGENYRDIVLTLRDYNVLQITHKAGLNLQSVNILGIGVGYKDSIAYHQLRYFPSHYDSTRHAYDIHFDLVSSFPQKLIQTTATIRYYFGQSLSTDIDTSLLLYVYPYASTLVFLRNPTDVGFLLQDFAMLGDKLYLHPTGPAGLFEYDLTSGTLAPLFIYGSGDHIAADSMFVFCEQDRTIDRYNLLQRAVDTHYTMPNKIWGLAAHKGILYVGLTDSRKSVSYVKVISYAGVSQDSVPYPRHTCYYMAIEDSILYSTEQRVPPTDEITRYNLRTRSFLPNVVSPALDCEGIDIVSQKLYFGDYQKSYIGVVSLGALVEVGRIPKNQTQ